MNAFRRVRSHWYLEPRREDTWKEAETETKVRYTEGWSLWIFNFYYCWCQALDSEQLPISEQFSSVSRRKIFPPPFPWNVSQCEDLGFFTSTCILSINSSLGVIWVSLSALYQQCPTLHGLWASFSCGEDKATEKLASSVLSTLSLTPLQSGLPWPPSWKQKPVPTPASHTHRVPLYSLNQMYQQLISSLY